MDPRRAAAKTGAKTGANREATTMRATTMRATHVWTFGALAVGALAVGAMAGCDVISGLSSIEAKPEGLTTSTASAGGAGGAGTTLATSSTGGATSTSSAGGGGSSATAGGGGAMPECSSPDDCDPTGTSCQLATCTDGACGIDLAPKGTACSDNGGETCDDEGNCVLGGCLDLAMNGTETDVDCGGSCKPCAESKGCKIPKDCSTAFCDLGRVHANGSPGTCGKCASDAACAMGEYCTVGGNCKKQLATGATCSKPSACLSGFCPQPDGFCCNTACDGSCDSCNQTGVEGTCTPVMKFDAGTPACTPYLCDGTLGTCPASCNGDADCIAGGFCRASNKTCHPIKLALAASCEAPNECSSTYCCGMGMMKTCVEAPCP